LSLALEVCRLAEEVMARERGVAVRGVGVEVGREAGVELNNFKFCLDALMQAPPFCGGAAEYLPADGATFRLAYVEVDDGRSED
jgi:Zn finger protein HypA/HybF involved in hydrogenase expression